MQQLFNVGKIVNTHGIRGELKILLLTDFPEQRFAKNSKLLIETPDAKRIDVTVESSRFQKNMAVVKFKDYGNINEVEKYKGSTLKVSAEYMEELDEDEFYFHEIVGCTVLTDEGEELGTIKEILTPGANDVWVVQTPARKELLIPYIEDVVLHVDKHNKRITVKLMEGLI
ncbi:ribosome maturation factor RimM [Paenibacillus sp. JX-17]|uniref:Ribosome maturation factor RimM n=1 Tax=Paenibacillus lacisoli TaxID=3064525 RepID=A0ABT9CAF3_9BACL|nr:ribosome maturation factor RimM [Paenibacillus sp. JX-17]MDO7905860.1 ribosome maturation factor RimM [Paenibacillus sp. JX-17]